MSTKSSSGLTIPVTFIALSQIVHLFDNYQISVGLSGIYTKNGFQG